MISSLLVKAYEFAAMCSFFLIWCFNKSSSFPSWGDVTPFVLIGSTHKPVVGSLSPVQKILSLKYTQHSCVLQTTLHPESVQLLIYISDVCAIPGTTCACQDFLGILRKLISHVCVDFNWVPSSRLMVRGFLLIFMLETFVPKRMKCTVAPESATAISTAILMFNVLSIVSAFGAFWTL